MVSNREIISFLKGRNAGGGFVDTLKIRYRPLICPFAALFPFVQEGDVVADIGCGSGQFALLLDRFTPLGAVVGIEISDRLVHNARALFAAEPHTRPHRFERYDGTNFPAELRRSDLFFLVDVLHHVPADEQQAFLDGIFAVMRPGARLVLKDIDGASPLVVFNKLHDLVFSGELGKERSLAVARDMALRAGFELLAAYRHRTAVYPHYVLALRKPVT